MASKKTIAFGGGGFTSATNPSLDDLLISEIDSDTKRIGYVGTASDDDPVRLKYFQELIAPRVSFASIKPTQLSIREAAAWAGQHDLIYVGGGDTAKMLSQWRATGFDKVLRDAGNDGVVLAGVSAGAVCWFENALVREPSGNLEPIDCLGFLKGSMCAHYNSDPERRSAFSDHIARGVIPAGVGVDDGVGVLYRGGARATVWSAEPGCWAYDLARDLRGDVGCSPLPGFVKG